MQDPLKHKRLEKKQQPQRQQQLVKKNVKMTNLNNSSFSFYGQSSMQQNKVNHGPKAVQKLQAKKESPEINNTANK